MRKAVIPHDKRGQTISQRIYARPRLGMRALVWPYDIKTRVNAWYRKPVQSGVAETEGREVIRVWKLRSW